ncbi:hypothetical protein CN97_00760 [Haematobacter massiliensis]|uniref:Uncharacterized protein n=1 Tax=Haematobacter massiliensis TaxID=195105 RepID=A0A086Y0E1_9RHOB|nr:hypothetical protein [Haematobacter massiliensis]KFI27741.1 hypothetical protein CN97_00760 [Haematobacter massiliensis]OWJ82714.1 hypothetical protein CDV51_17045 [Haematobacter massiliensis]
MSFYDEMKGVADGLLAEFAQGTVTAYIVTPGAPDPAQPWVAVPPSETSAALDAVVRGVPEALVDGTNILVGDLLVIFAVPDVTVSVGDRIVIDGKSLGVVQVSPIPPSGTTVAMQAVVRT